MRKKEAKKTWNKVCEKYLGIVQRQYENRKLSVQFEIDAFGENKPLLQTRGFPGGSDGKECAPGREDPLEKEMATHSSILGWRIPWTEEPGKSQSMGSQGVGHD